MAGRDNVLFSATVASGATAGTVIPLSLAYGIENVRQGYGTARLKNVRAFYNGCYSSGHEGMPIEIKNSNWIDTAGLVAAAFNQESSLNRDNLGFMRGRDKVLQPNTSWMINAVLANTTTSAGTVYVLLEIEYSDVQGYDAEKQTGAPVYKKCTNAAVTAAADVPTSIGSFDNLLQGVQYIISEVGVIAPAASRTAFFVILEGFSNQKGLTRIIPAKSTGLADQVEGSVILTKQTYNISILSASAITAAPVSIGFEMIANTN